MKNGEIFTTMGIFRDGLSDAAPAISGWARANPGNDVAVSMRISLTNALNAWFMPSCSGRSNDPCRNAGRSGGLALEYR